MTTTLTYDTTGDVTSSTDPTGAVTRMTYGPDGEVQTVSDALGDTTTNNYDTNGNLLSTFSAAGVATSYGYDSNNNLTSVTDPNGNPTGTSMTWVDPSGVLPNATLTTSTNYDANDRVTGTVDQYNHTTQTKYDVKGRVTQTIDVLSNVTTNVYDARDELIRTIYPADPNYPQSPLQSESVYDAEGRVIYATDPHLPIQADIRGTHTIYDSMGRVKETDRLDGMNIIITTTPNGVSSSQLDPNKQGTPISSTITNYNDLGQVTQTLDALNNPTTYQYDLAGRQTSVADALSETTTTGYDLAGRQISSTDALTQTTQYVLDGDGKVLKTIFADGSFTLNGYDSLGRRTTATDQMGLTTTYQYDIFGRLTGVVLPPVPDPLNGNTVVNPTTNYSYDIYGDMTQIQDAYQRQTKFTFDQFGHQLTRTLPYMPTGSQPETNTYDAYGRLSSVTDFAGTQTVYGYDTLGRVHTKTLNAKPPSTASETITYHFDNWGRNDTVTDVIAGGSTRTTTYGYDIENRVTSVTTPEGTINYGYDQKTGRHTETTTANSDINYVYDAVGRVQKVNVLKQNGQTANLTISYNYYPVGTVKSIIYPNGTETDYGYDTLNRLTSVTNMQGTTQLSKYSYTLNADGLRIGVTETDILPSSVTKTWTYDNLQRLIGEAVVSNVSGQSYTDTYSYDLVGNRLSKTDVVVTTTTVTTVTTDFFNADDQLTSETGTVNGSSSWSTSFQYLDGSLTNVTRTGAGAETDSYTYDLQNRLSGANISRTENGQGVTITATYSYDDSGYRAYGSVTVNGTTTTTNYLTDTINPTGYTQVLEEHTGSSGTLSMSYVIGLSVLGQTPASGGTSFFMTDGQGSTRQVTDPTGTISARFAFDAYGNLLYIAVGALNPPATKILYTGQQFDTTLLWYNLRARFMIPSVGRFNRMDPFSGNHSDPLTLNKYLYSWANPVNRADPIGMGDLTSLTITIAIGLFLTATFAGLSLGIHARKPVRGLFAGATLGFALAYVSFNKERIWPAFVSGVTAAFIAALIESTFYFVTESGNEHSPAEFERIGAEYKFTVFEAFAYAFFNGAFEFDPVSKGNLAIQTIVAGVQAFADAADSPDPFHKGGQNLVLLALQQVVAWGVSNFHAMIAKYLAGAPTGLLSQLFAHAAEAAPLIKNALVNKDDRIWSFVWDLLRETEKKVYDQATESNEGES